MSPSEGSGGSQTFRLIYSDPNGHDELGSVYALISDQVSMLGACYLVYNYGSNILWLVNDAGTGLLGPANLGSVGALANSQCEINLAASAASGAGDSLTVDLALSFQPSFTGLKNFYLYATDTTSRHTGWQLRGTWTPNAAPTAVSVSITPVRAWLTASQARQFAATVTGASDKSVTWSLDPPVGSVSSGGFSTSGTTAVYTAPSVIHDGLTVELTATSVADPTKSAAALLVLVPVVNITVNPPSLELKAGQSQQLTATVTGAADHSVRWSLSPPLGTISETGIYTAPSTITTPQTVVARAVSVADPARSATAIILLIPAAPTRLTITSPPDGARIGGTATFAVNASGLPTTASVEYLIGGKTLAIADEPPFSLTYNTAILLDGQKTLQARAWDAFGNLVDSTDELIQVSNLGNAIVVNSPDLDSTWSGDLRLSFTSTDPEYFPAFLFASLDGEHAARSDIGIRAPVNPWVGNSSVFDTTRFFNGTHQLHLSAHSLEVAGEQRTRVNYRAMLTRMVTIDNGHALMELVSNYLHVYLTPGQQITLTCTAVYTDQVTEPCDSPAYSVDDTSVASVNSGGVVTASADGFTKVTISSAGKQTEAYVWVRADHHIPHFAGNGEILQRYSPGKSLFVVAPFVLEPAELSDRSPNLLSEVLRAGVNTLQQGFYPNPRSLSTTWESWKSDYDRRFVPNWTYAASVGLHLLPSGDDVARRIGGEAWWTLNWPYGKQAVQYAMQKLAESGVAVAVDVVDEASLLWGGTPTPPGKVGGANSFTSITCSGETCRVAWPSNPVRDSRRPFGADFALAGSANPNLNTPPGQLFTAGNVTEDSFDFKPAGPVTGKFTAENDPQLEFLWWAGPASGCPDSPCNPPVPNTAITTISSWIRTASAAVPISWPALGVHGAAVHGNWVGKGGVRDGISDFASHYWDTKKPAKTYSWGWGTEEANYWMRDAFYLRQPYMDLERPQIMLTSLMGPAYKKGQQGGHFNPPGDTLQNPGTTPEAIVSNMATAAALGNVGSRLYSYDRVLGTSGREKADLGRSIQTGANPFDSNVEHWEAMAYAANLLTKVLEPFVLGKALSSPAYGRNIVTAVREDHHANRMLLVVNGGDVEKTVAVDFSAYRTGNRITRYRLTANSITSDVLPDSGGEVITLGDGESVAYLFALQNTTTFTQPVRLVPPVGHPGVKAIVKYSYIYEKMLRSRTQGVLCSPDCILDLDRRLGDVYYQFTYLSLTDEVIGKSQPFLYASGLN